MNSVIEKRAPVCPYCGHKSDLMRDSSGLYNGRNFGPVWICRPCDAWVGCHRGGINPLGRLANSELRMMKRAAHNAFDPLWKRKQARDRCTKTVARIAGYRWLAEQLCIPPDQCHIGMFDVDQCKRVIEVCTNPNARRNVQGCLPLSVSSS